MAQLNTDGIAATRSGSFVKEADVQLEEIGPGLSRKLLGFGPTIMGARVQFEKGAVGEMHRHPHAQIAFVEAGRFEVTIDGETEVLGPGDSFYVAPDLMHGAVCLEKGVLIDVFSPQREDFLPKAGDH